MAAKATIGLSANSLSAQLSGKHVNESDADVHTSAGTTLMTMGTVLMFDIFNCWLKKCECTHELQNRMKNEEAI